MKKKIMEELEDITVKKAVRKLNKATSDTKLIKNLLTGNLTKAQKRKVIIFILAVILVIGVYLFLGSSDENESSNDNDISVSDTTTTTPTTTEPVVTTEPTTEATTTTTEATTEATTTTTIIEEVEQLYYFRNQTLLDQHYEKHGIEMGFDSAKAYETAASMVAQSEEALHKTEEEDGDDVYYIEKTNEFVVVSGDGFLRTYFLPTDGIDYYNRQ